MRRYRTIAKQLLFLLVALVIVLLLGRSMFRGDATNGTTAEPLSVPETRGLRSTDVAPTNRAGIRCPGTGLAAVDLAGNCRATPKATMGALEAVDK